MEAPMPCPHFYLLALKAGVRRKLNCWFDNKAYFGDQHFSAFNAGLREKVESGREVIFLKSHRLSRG